MHKKHIFENEPIVIDRPPKLGTVSVNKEKIDTPKQYHVMLWNDDNTPSTVVIEVLSKVFGLNSLRATKIMMAAHVNGKAIVATMSRDMAETKANQAMDLALQYDNPVTKKPVFLQFSTEEA